MQLLTEKIKKQLIDNFNNKDSEGTKEFKVVCKLFNPIGDGTWYLTELDPKTNIAFGLCVIFEAELGNVCMTELTEYVSDIGIGIERDILFKTNHYTLEECKKLFCN